jgi:hypothetical protein
VRVNRIWQQLFGGGIVTTSDNLGASGLSPSHPELLEWLSCAFRDQGQHLKPLLKLLMTSTVYRQASSERSMSPAVLATARRVDPDNRLLWRMPLRRLEAESVRDSILAVSGRLEPSVGGPPILVDPKPDGTFVPRAGKPSDLGRRTIYLLARRNYHPTLLNVFDQPNLTTNCTRRTSSAVVLQTLAMLNDAFVLEQAGFLAKRVTDKSNSTEPRQRIDSAFWLVLCRPASPEEMALSEEFLRRQGVHFRQQKRIPADAERKALEQLCHMLLNTSEFLYVP